MYEVLLLKRKRTERQSKKVTSPGTETTSVVASANPNWLVARQVYFQALSLSMLFKVRHPWCWKDGTKVSADFARDHSREPSASQQSFTVVPGLAYT